MESPSYIGSGVWPQVGVIKKSTSSNIRFIYLIKRVRIFAAFIKSEAGFIIKVIFHYQGHFSKKPGNVAGIPLGAVMSGYIDVGDGCWRRNVLVTI